VTRVPRVFPLSPHRYDFADQALFSQFLHHRGTTSLASVEDTSKHIIECSGSTDDVMLIKVVSVLYQLLVSDGFTLEPWKASPFASTILNNMNIAKCLFFARLWLQSTALLFGDEVLSLRDVEKDCAVLSIMFSDRDQAIPWPASRDKVLLQEHLTAQLADQERFAPSYVEAVCYVFNQCMKLPHNPVTEWTQRWKAAHDAAQQHAGLGSPISIKQGILDFDT
jgi:hypothetical protein